MRAVVFGAGLMGSTIARDLIRSNDVEQVTLCDIDKRRLSLVKVTERSSKLKVRVHDVRRGDQTVRLLKQSDVGIGALPYDLCEYPIKATLQAGVNFVDLIFGWRYKRSDVDAAAKRKGISVVPACGFAPGLSNILAKAGIDQMDKVEEVHIKTGGIPERPTPPLNYRIVFSFDAVLEEYSRKARIVRNGKIVDVEALSGLETINFLPPIGKCECFYTDGLSTLIHTVKGVREMSEKTIRWPGHVAQIRTLIECGLLESRPITYRGKKIIPKDFVGQILTDRLALRDERDLTLLRVDIIGRRKGSFAHTRSEMIDHFDKGRVMTSMARTTAFPCAATALLLGNNRVSSKGLVPAELAFDEEQRDWLVSYLAARKIDIKSKSL
jgi:lysine 6-dehydrogenase